MFRSPLFAWSPRRDQDRNQDPFASPASQSPSRFGALHSNVRTMIHGSSIYSQSPALENNTTPKAPFLGLFRRDQSNVLPASHDAPHGPNDSRTPLHAQHTAGSYIGAIAPRAGPPTPETVYHRHPADVPLPQQSSDAVDPEVQLAADINDRRKRRKHSRRKHRQPQADRWVRRRNEQNAQGPLLFVRGSPARGKMIACIISGSLLLTVLSIYLAIALTNHDLGQEVHILFIMVLLAITIFFCHSLIRLCMLILNPPREHNRPHIADMTNPDGFRPIVPIRVHLARDEEAGEASETDVDRDLDLEKDPLPPPPPPAYGLWRSSVRVDPNLLHWRRAEGHAQPQENRSSVFTDLSYSQNDSVSNAPTAPLVEGPRPPSYASEDGVSYIVEAAPRSTVRRSLSGVSDIHPAWRPGYAVSDVTVWPGGRR
ncbi:hypothetical protein BDU57DRAFT_453735 [Ampelomyces quisqualis]|uniref:Uncharacterized protein n=1 Tax=Ampelomyces quisqualis TaxID=50730 RepID=A0A6A5QFT6_AMPQU|nr:hypothetical protein BDU57DRAFT_453735 [Ampelomyces quisqualis]